MKFLLHLNENYVRKGIFKNMPTVKRERSTSRASSRKSSPKKGKYDPKRTSFSSKGNG